MNLRQLRERISDSTIAIVAVHLFGILERIRELKDIASRAGVLLVEDSAQAFPGGQEPNFWRADLVVLSFGRGKPVSALGGGAVLTKQAQLAELLPEISPPRSPGFIKQMKNKIKISLYNRLINPRLYWLPNSLPFLHLGETRYQPLSAIQGTDTKTILRVASNAQRFRAYPLDTQTAIRAAVKRLTADGKALVNLPEACAQYAGRRLLRYPLLVSDAARDRCLQALNAAGLGATTMYPASLPAISGLKSLFAKQDPCLQAERFARRIITLPTHPGVRPGDVEAIERVLQTCA
jgi:dTDP-4-amino-4,6-dideoxygalactose transaminase